MSLYYEDAGLRLFHGSNKEVLPTFEAESFDSIITDPPYELGFMGKEWDSSGIAYDVEMWVECLRVLKPGGHLLAFGGTRTWHRIAAAIEDAGFEIRDSIAWMYGQGFPKSMDVAKEIDKKAGHWRGRAGEVKSANGAMSGENYERTEKGDPVTAAAAAAWQGWGTSLKPAFEPIIVARKPLASTVAANVLAYGTGAINIDACRVPTSDSLGGGAATGGGLSTKSDGWARPWMADEDAVAAHAERVRENIAKAESLGRFPSNVLLDESQAAALDEQTGVLTSGLMKAGTERAPRKGGTIHGADQRNITAGDTYGDTGGASRFFPKFALTAEDVEWQRRFESLPSFRYEAKAPSSERPEVDGTVHSTVKPLALMRWLVRLVTREGGRVLDLFAGSGTTGEAALLEGMEVDLIELEADHLPLILQRVRKPLQPSMFGDWEVSA